MIVIACRSFSRRNCSGVQILDSTALKPPFPQNGAMYKSRLNLLSTSELKLFSLVFLFLNYPELVYCPLSCLPDISSNNTFTCLRPWSIPSLLSFTRIESVPLLVPRYLHVRMHRSKPSLNPDEIQPVSLPSEALPNTSPSSQPPLPARTQPTACLAPYITKWNLLALLACHTSRTLSRLPCVMSSNPFSPAYLIEKPSRNR